MFQVEDLIRSLNLDMEKIDELIIQKYELSYNDKRDLREWYLSIIRHLSENGLRDRGHSPFLHNLMNEINDLHISLINNPGESNYHQLFKYARPSINELRLKSGSPDKHDIEICLEGLYGLLLLRLSRKKTNPETEKAFGTISMMLSYLSAKFKETDDGLSAL